MTDKSLDIPPQDPEAARQWGGYKIHASIALTRDEVEAIRKFEAFNKQLVMMDLPPVSVSGDE